MTEARRKRKGVYSREAYLEMKAHGLCPHCKQETGGFVVCQTRRDEIAAWARAHPKKRRKTWSRYRRKAYRAKVAAGICTTMGCYSPAGDTFKCEPCRQWVNDRRRMLRGAAPPRRCSGCDKVVLHDRRTCPERLRAPAVDRLPLEHYATARKEAA